MAGVPGVIQPLEVFADTHSGAGVRIGEGEAVGRNTAANPTSYSPQFADPVFTGRPINLQTIQPLYDRPEQRVTRAPRMPRHIVFGIDRTLSVSAWPFNPALAGRPARQGWVGMTGARLPMYGPGWGEPRRNIVAQPSIPYGELSALYPHIYAQIDGVY